MRSLVEADLEPDGLEELPKDVIRRGREQALASREFVEMLDRPRSNVEMLTF
jgi:hypothetical protein